MGYFYNKVDAVGNVINNKKVNMDFFYKYKVSNQEGVFGRLGYRQLSEYCFDSYGYVRLWESGTTFYPPEFVPNHDMIAIAMAPKANGDLVAGIASSVFVFELNKDFEPSFENFYLPQGDVVYNDKERFDAYFDAYYWKEQNEIQVICLAQKKKKLGFENSKLVSILYQKNKPKRVAEILINEKADLTDFLPAKDGNVVIIEYFSKQKKIEKRFQKLNYS